MFKKFQFVLFLILIVLFTGCSSTVGVGHVMHPPKFNTNQFINNNEISELNSYDFSRLKDHCLIIFSYNFTGIMGDKAEGIRIYEQSFASNANEYKQITETFPVDAVKTLATYRGFKVNVSTQAIKGSIIYAGCIKVDLSDINTEPKAIIIDKQNEIENELKVNNIDFSEKEIIKSLFTAELFYSK